MVPFFQLHYQLKTHLKWSKLSHGTNCPFMIAVRHKGNGEHMRLTDIMPRQSLSCLQYKYPQYEHIEKVLNTDLYWFNMLKCILKI